MIVVGVTAQVSSARDHIDGFDDGQPTWALLCDKSEARVKRQIRSTDIRHSGAAAELIEVEVASAVVLMQLAYPLPPARLIEDTRLSLWFQSTQDAAVVVARVVLPNQIDPQTGSHMIVPVEGDAYTKVGQWQKLECNNIDRRFKQLLPQIRRRLQTAGGLTHLDITGRYVDTVVVKINSSRGASQFVVDELQFGPLVEVRAENRIRQVERSEAAVEPDAKLQLGRLFVRGQPFFFRGIPYHGEQPADLARMRLNLVWVPELGDTQLLADLDQAGLRAMAVPPRTPARTGLPGKDGAPHVDAVSMHLAPFGTETSNVLFWYLGTQIEPGARREITAWQEQIRNADRVYQRPLMGDVAGAERSYSKQLSMLGIHRPAVQTSFSPKHYRDWLIEHRRLAQPSTFLWTWIQTEAPPSVNAVREAAGWHPQVVEPEQLRLQVYGALAAGCRGIAYWTNSSLDDDQPGAAERRLMIEVLNMELELLEPLLASGSVTGQATFTASQAVTRKTSSINAPTNAGKSARTREQEIADRDTQNREHAQLSNLEAAVIHTDDSGLLVLPIWYADEAQYVPGRMVAPNAKIVVPGVGESARAYEISTTQVRELEAQRVTGGTQVTLQVFDTTAMILFTENGRLVERIREQVKRLAPSAARATIDLARAKHERVAALDTELHKMGWGQRDADRRLIAAKQLLARAENEYGVQHYRDARDNAALAMQQLRTLQHDDWADAAHRMYSPVASPHTLCYQTLPDHWQMIARFGRTLGGDTRNLLRSGDCEDLDTMVAAGWTRTETAVTGVQSTAELHPRAHQGTYALRLVAAAATGADPPATIPERLVTVVSPSVTVYKGQLVYIKGWVKIATACKCNLDGAVFYDSLGGPATALRWRAKSDWQKFELTREVTETTEMNVTMSLSGLGDIRFDDIEIIPLDVDNSPGKGAGKNAGPARAPRGPLDFLRRIPGFGGSKTEPD